MLLWAFACISVFAAGIYGAFFSGYFVVTRVDIEGSKRMSRADLHSAIEAYLREPVVGGMILRSNFFLVSTDALRDRIQKEFPGLSAATVSKSFPDRLNVAVRERVYGGVWCGTQIAAGESCFLIDTEGVLYDSAASSSGTLVMVLRDDMKNPAMGNAVVEPRALLHLSELRENLRKRFNFVAREYYLGNLPDVTAFMAGGWRLLFDIDHSGDSVLGVLKKTIDDARSQSGELAGQNIEERLEYIDLRIEGRAYYKSDP